MEASRFHRIKSDVGLVKGPPCCFTGHFNFIAMPKGRTKKDGIFIGIVLGVAVRCEDTDKKWPRFTLSDTQIL
jgi:hypothetical protein